VLYVLALNPWLKRRRNDMRKMVLLIIILLPALLIAQAEKKQDIWAPLKSFVGKWEGKGEGMPGISKAMKDFQFIMNGKYLLLKGKSIYEPQKKNPKGEVHEDWGFFSYDQFRKKFVLRQFHIEGFIIHYALENIPEDGKTFVFVSEQIENAPPGWGAKVTYKFMDADTINEQFDLATSEKGFDCYIVNILKRKK